MTIHDTAATPVALVTGGGSGIGAAMSRQLANHGFHVVVVDIDQAGARQTAESVAGMALHADVSDLAANHAMVATTLATYGRLDVVALNAGINYGLSHTEPLDLVHYRRATAVNIDGVVFGIDSAVPALTCPGGAIVVTSSLAVLAPQAANPVYTLSKSAVVGYIRALAAPLQERGLTINALCPSFTDTPMLGQSRSILDERGIPVLGADDVAAALLEVLDGGRTGEAWSIVPGRKPVPYDYPDALLDA